MKFCIHFIFLLYLGYSFGQDVKEIKPLAQDLIQKTIAGDFDQVLDYTYPRIFEFVTKDQMKEIFIMMLKNDDFEITFIETDSDLTLGEPKEINNGKYVLVSYQNAMLLKYYDMANMDADFLLNIFKETYPDGKVTYNEDQQYYSIHIKSKMLAIADAYTENEWRFLNVNKNDKNMMQMILDPEVINAFGL